MVETERKIVNTPPDFHHITAQSLSSIINLVQRDGGSIIVAEPSDDGFRVDLFADAKIDKEYVYASEKCWKATGSRQYSLRRARISRDGLDHIRSLADRLAVGGFNFHIGGLFTWSRSYLHRDFYVLYIPKGQSVEKALRHTLWVIMEKINSLLEEPGRTFLFDETMLDEVMQYIMHDLETEEVLRHNIAAGMEADALLGI
jgi:hypothetical protein